MYTFAKTTKYIACAQFGVSHQRRRATPVEWLNAYLVFKYDVTMDIYSAAAQHYVACSCVLYDVPASFRFPSMYVI